MRRATQPSSLFFYFCFDKTWNAGHLTIVTHEAPLICALRLCLFDCLFLQDTPCLSIFSICRNNVKIWKFWLLDGSLDADGFFLKRARAERKCRISTAFSSIPLMSSLWKGHHRQLDMLLTLQTHAVHRIIVVASSLRSHVKWGEVPSNEGKQVFELQTSRLLVPTTAPSCKNMRLIMQEDRAKELFRRNQPGRKRISDNLPQALWWEMIQNPTRHPFS